MSDRLTQIIDAFVKIGGSADGMIGFLKRAVFVVWMAGILFISSLEEVRRGLVQFRETMIATFGRGEFIRESEGKFGDDH
jgi:hypothetical protein